MPALRQLLAFLGGVVLYYVGVVLLGGVLAALAVSKEYFSLFGKQHLELALAVLNVGTWALPVVAFVAMGAYGIAVLLKGNHRATFVSMSLGMLVCFVYWHLVFVQALPPANKEGANSVFLQFFSTLAAPWWAAPNFVAPWLGLAAGLWFAVRRSSRPYKAAV